MSPPAGGAFAGLFGSSGGGKGKKAGALLDSASNRFAAAPRAAVPTRGARVATTDVSADAEAPSEEDARAEGAQGGAGEAAAGGKDGNAVKAAEAAEAPKEEQHSAAELARTVFVGNVSVGTRARALKTRFGEYGKVATVRLRSLPLAADATVSRAVAARKGAKSGALAADGTMNAYVKFEEEASAAKALAANMSAFNGRTIRVDRVRPPTERAASRKGEAASCGAHYDPRRTLFIGGLPYDVREDELVALFGAPAPGVPATRDYGVEAVRVLRERATGTGKGVAYVLFKTRVAAREALGREGGFKLRSGAERRRLRVAKCDDDAAGAARGETRGERRQNERRVAARSARSGGEFDGKRRAPPSREGGVAAGRGGEGERPAKKPRHRDRGDGANKKARKSTAAWEGNRAVPGNTMGFGEDKGKSAPRGGAKRPSVIARKSKQLRAKAKAQK